MGLFDFIAKAAQPEKETVTPSTYAEEIFFVVGTEYCEEAINRLATGNPNWRKGAKGLAELDLCGKKVYRYNYIHKPVKLIPEPKNKHDKNAVIVQIAGEKVGYISRDDNRHVKNILEKKRVKFISAFISGGEYKVVSTNGDTVKMDSRISIKIKIGYA